MINNWNKRISIISWNKATSKSQIPIKRPSNQLALSLLHLTIKCNICLNSLQVVGHEGDERGAHQGAQDGEASRGAAGRARGGGCSIISHHGAHWGRSKDDGTSDLLHLHNVTLTRRDRSRKGMIIGHAEKNA